MLLRSYLTTPSAATEAVVLEPISEVQTFIQCNFWSLEPFALYVKGICLAALSPSNVTRYKLCYGLFPSLTGVTVIGLLVVFVVFTVTASRAASLTALRETFTSYLAFASPVCFAVSYSDISDVSVACSSRFLTTLSTAALSPVGKLLKSILAVLFTALSLPSTYSNVTVLSAFTVYVLSLI